MFIMTEKETKDSKVLLKEKLRKEGNRRFIIDSGIHFRQGKFFGQIQSSHYACTSVNGNL